MNQIFRLLQTSIVVMLWFMAMGWIHDRSSLDVAFAQAPTPTPHDQSMTDDMNASPESASDSCPSETASMEGMGGMVMNDFDPMNAVHKGRDLDGDGDADEITICLQVLDVNEEIAPGTTLPFWVFAPDLGGQEPLSRLPSPTLRFEQGDHVRIVVKNTHLFPHTLHMHGVIKPNEMDGIPNITQDPIVPGESFVYEFVAQNAGTYWYHCHVQPPVHILMGLYGMLIIEPNRPQNDLTPIVMTSKMPELSQSSQESGFDAEYTLTYSNVDPDLNTPYLDTRLSLSELAQKMHREYNSTERLPRYFLLNGRSFPFTILDSPIELKANQKVLLRVLNVGPEVVSLHLHGHHAEIIAKNGIDIPTSERKPMDTIEITAGQRLDLELNTAIDGIHGSGPGVWLLHDHTEQAITTNGISPGGNLSFMVYEEKQNIYGLPEVTGDLSTYFSPDYYIGDQPVFDMAPYNQDSSTTPGFSWPWAALPLWAWLALMGLGGVILGAGVAHVIVNLVKNSARKSTST